MSNKATLEYEAPSQQKLLADADTSLMIAQSVKISSPATYDIAAEELREVKTTIKELGEKRMAITRKLDEAKTLIMDVFKPALARLDEAKIYYERGMLTYVQEQELAKRLEQERLEAVAKAERDRLAAEARELEAKAKAIEDAAKAAAAKEKNAEVRARLEAEAEANAAQAREDALAAQMTAEVIVAAPSTIVAPQAAGTSVRKVWKARCTNKLELLAFIVAHPEHVGLVDVNDAALHALAKSQHENMKVAGCEAYQDSSITSRK